MGQIRDSGSRSEPPKRPSILTRVPLSFLLLLCLCSLLPFLNSLGNGFTFDDLFIVQNNPLVTDPFRIEEIFTSNYWGSYQNLGAYRPLTILSFHVNAFFGFAAPKPFWFHGANLLLNLANTLLLFFLFLLLFQDPLQALFPALLFSLHPIHTEAVTSVVGRSELLSAFFLLSSFLLFVRSLSPFRSKTFFLSLLLYTLGLLSKENCLTLLGLLPLYGLFWHKRLQGKSPSHRTWLIPFLGFLIPTFFYLLIRMALFGLPWKIQHGVDPIKLRYLNPLFGAESLPRLFTCAYVFGRYLKLLFFPTALSADYSHPEIPFVTAPYTVSVLIPLLFFFCTFALFPLLWRRAPALLFGIAWFYATFSIVSNLFLSVGTIMGERLLYLPSAGFCVALASPLSWLYRKREFRRGALLVLVVLVATLALRTARRNLDWTDNLTLFEKTSKTSPRCARNWSNLGWAYFEQASLLEGIDMEQSRKSMEKAAWATDNSIALQTPSARVRANRAKIAFHLGDFDRVVQEIKSLLEDPGEEIPVFIKGDLLRILGKALYLLGKRQEGLRIMEQAFQLIPDDEALKEEYRSMLEGMRGRVR